MEETNEDRELRFTNFKTTHGRLLIEELKALLLVKGKQFGYMLRNEIKNEGDFNTAVEAMTVKAPLMEELFLYVDIETMQVARWKKRLADFEAQALIIQQQLQDNIILIEEKDRLLELSKTALQHAEQAGHAPPRLNLEPEPPNESEDDRLVRLFALSMSTALNSTRVPAHVPKLNNQVYFNGNSSDKDNIILWLNGIELKMSFCEMPSNRKVACASTYLSNLALIAFQNWNLVASPSELSDWDLFSDMMKKKFLPLDHVAQIRYKLLQLKQTGSVASYNAAFDRLLCQLASKTNSSELETLYNAMYNQGLSTVVREHVQYFMLETVKESMTRALLFDSTHPSIRNNYGNELPDEANVVQHNYTKHRNRKDFRGGKMNNKDNSISNLSEDMMNISSNTPPATSSSKSGPPKLSCSHCSKAGHTAEKCFILHPELKNAYHSSQLGDLASQKKRQHSKQSHVNTGDFPKKVNTVFTHTADPDHVFCKVAVEIEGEILECILDSGAKTTVIPTQFARKLGLKLKNDKLLCQVATGQFEYASVTCPVEVKCCGTVTLLEMVVFDRENSLIGVDWMNANKAYVNTYKHTLNFENRVFSLINENEDALDIVPYCQDFSMQAMDTLVVSADDIAEIEQDCDHEQWPLTGEVFRSDSDFCILESDVLSISELASLNSFIDKNKSIFARDISDIKQKCNVSKFNIKLSDNTGISQRPYRVSPKERNHINDCVKEMVAAGICRPSCSPYKSPVVLIPKKGGELRFCVDYRRLNRKTIKDGYPLPLIQESFDRLKGSTIFTSLDLKAGYWLMEIDEESIPLTSFVTSDGQYEFLVLPFGVTNGPAFFSRVMNSVLQGLEFVEIYLDDILVHSKTLNEHFDHVDIVLKRLADAKLKLNFKKCFWFRKELKFLGHIVANGVIKTDNEKIRIIEKWQTPLNVIQVLQFLGLAGHYRKFVKNFANIAHPLHELTKKSKIWQWSPECQAAFDSLKQALISSPILRMPDFTKKFTIFTDASAVALGAILGQGDPDNSEFEFQPKFQVT